MAAEVRITVSQQGTGSAAKDAAKDIRNLGDAAKDAGGGVSALKEVAIGAFREIGALGVGVALDSLKALSGAVMDGIADAREAAKVNAQTEAVIKSMGNAAGVSSQHVQDFAASLSAAAGQSLFGDSQIQESSNLLLTFDKIKGETLDVATALTVDLAQALGGEPKDQAMMLGKALNDPIKGITALGRAGLTFSEEQKDMIRALVETGDVAGAQNIILAELEKQVGGSAAAAAAADGGWAQFNDRLGEAKETIGAAILPLLSVLVGFLNDTVMPAVEAAATAFAAWLADPAVQAGAQQLIAVLTTGWSAIQPVLAVVVGLIGELASAFVDAGPFSLEFAEAIGTISPALGGMFAIAAQVLPQLQGLVQQVFGDIAAFFRAHGAEMLGEAQATWSSIQATIQSLVGPIVAIVQALLAQIMAFWKAHGDDIMAFVRTTWKEINDIIQVAMKLIQATIVPALKFIASFINDHGSEIQTILGATWDAIKAIITGALALIKGIITAALQLIQGDFQGAWDTIQSAQETAGQALVSIVQSVMTIIGTVFSSAWDKIKSDVSGAATVITGAVTDMGNGIVSILTGLPGRVSGVGEAVMNAIWNGMKAVWDQIVNWLNEQLAWFESQLPGSEPKDRSSPLYGLGRRGAAIVTNLVDGMKSAAPMVASAGALVAGNAAAGVSSTYNRSMSMTQNYYGVPAAPAMDFATAQSLAGV